VQQKSDKRGQTWTQAVVGQQGIFELIFAHDMFLNQTTVVLSNLNIKFEKRKLHLVYLHVANAFYSPV
jgi:hypothetical protein